MAKTRKIYPLDFDSSGSAIIRFFGKLAFAPLHPAEVKLPNYRLICPYELNNTECKLCAVPEVIPEDKAEKRTQRFFIKQLSFGWDCRKKRWAFLLGSKFLFDDIFNKCIKVGTTIAMMEAGSGPDVYLQRMGYQTEVEVATNTIGKERGPQERPTIENVIKQILSESIWTKIDSLSEAERLYPKDIKAS